MGKHSGFTLIELIVTLALAVIVLTFGVPAFQGIIRNNRLATVINEFIGALNLTRSEAIKRGVRVTLCKSNDGANCASSGGYEQGWIVFIDPNGNAAVDTGEPIIRVFEGAVIETGMTLTGNLPVARYISYVATGATESTSGAFQAGTLALCAVPNALRIVINRVGRIRTEAASCL